MFKQLGRAIIGLPISIIDRSVDRDITEGLAALQPPIDPNLYLEVYREKVQLTQLVQDMKYNAEIDKKRYEELKTVVQQRDGEIKRLNTEVERLQKLAAKQLDKPIIEPGDTVKVLRNTVNAWTCKDTWKDANSPNGRNCVPDDTILVKRVSVDKIYYASNRSPAGVEQYILLKDVELVSKGVKPVIEVGDTVRVLRNIVSAWTCKDTWEDANSPNGRNCVPGDTILVKRVSGDRIHYDSNRIPADVEQYIPLTDVELVSKAVKQSEKPVIEPGDTVRVLRNNVSAWRNDTNQHLKPGDTVIVKRTDGQAYYTKSGPNCIWYDSLHPGLPECYLPLTDVELVSKAVKPVIEPGDTVKVLKNDVGALISFRQRLKPGDTAYIIAGALAVLIGFLAARLLESNSPRELHCATAQNCSRPTVVVKSLGKSGWGSRDAIWYDISTGKNWLPLTDVELVSKGAKKPVIEPGDTVKVLKNTVGAWKPENSTLLSKGDTVVVSRIDEVEPGIYYARTGAPAYHRLPLRDVALVSKHV